MRVQHETGSPSVVSSLAKALVWRAWRRAPAALTAGLMGVTAFAASATAQQAIVQPGFAVVTGFSGFVQSETPDGADAFDYLSINPDGPATQVIDLTTMGAQGSLSAAPKPFTLSAGQVGQVFGVALDNSPQRNFYLAATSAYGLSIYTPDENGVPRRLREGAPGAQFVPGQFGPPETGSGPNAIWRVDGETGEVTLLTTIDSGTGSVAGLGGLAFDPVTKQIFAAERGTGLIHRIGLDGTVMGTYDHGVEGRPGAGLPPVAMAPLPPVNIESPAFDTGNPQTWGFAQPARRVFALAVLNRRLYYSIAQGPQIWSAAISAAGKVSGSGARLEVEVPSLSDGIEISSITFDSQGRMYLAERGATTGDYSLNQLADEGQSRVLRYVPKPAGDASPGRWRLAPDQYSVGLPPAYSNANGGVALAFGYRQDGTVNLSACGATLWSTGERLLDPGDGSEGFEAVDGLQGNGVNLFQPQNVPPLQAWFVDYDDQPGNPDFRGYMGALATIPCAGQAPPPVVCPQGTYLLNGQCLLFPTCPPGTKFQGGECVYPQCPPNYVLQQGQCVPPPQSCPANTVYYQGQCVPLDCPPTLVRLPNGYCACPANNIYFKGKCVPPQACPPGTIKLGGICICPLGLLFQNGQCSPFQCPDGQVLNIEGKCEPVQCPLGQEYKNGQCKPIVCAPNKDLFNGKCVNKCLPGQFHTIPNGACGSILCGFPLVPYNGQCVAPCPPKQHHTMPNGVCKPNFVVDPGPLQIFCVAPKEPYNGQCVNPCPPKQHHTMPNGVCKSDFVIDPGPLQIFCVAPQETYNGQCVNPCPPKQHHTMPNGACKSNFVIDPGPLQILCIAPLEAYNGKCVAKCPPTQVHTMPNGTCKPKFGLGLDVLQPILCVAPNEMVNGDCVPPCPPGSVRKNDGTCGPKLLQVDPNLIQILCVAPKEAVNGQCVDPCPPKTIRKPDGTCGPKFLQLNPKLQLQINP